MNVVIYARYSSHSQTEQSIEGQLKACYEYAKNNNMTVIGEYIDRALTGTIENRPQFQKMIKDSQKKQFQGVLVYQLDRFARNRYDSANYKVILKKNGVRVLSAKEHISDDASGILVEGVLESMAEYYSAELSQKIRRGMDLNAQKGLSTGGNIALGYKVDDQKRFIVDHETAPIVKIVFEMYADGKSITEIIEYLNGKNYKTSRGVAFNKNSLRKMLRNKRYIGIYTYKDSEIKDGIPRIISDELFYQVAELLNKNKKAPARTKAKAEYLLTTKLFCGHCKDMMTGESGTSKTGKSYHYYKCNNARKKKCFKKSVKKEYIENYVVDECRKLLTDENINKIAKEVVKLCEQEKDQSELKRLNKLLKENERKRNNIINAIAECDIDTVRKSLYEHISVLEDERKNLEKQISVENMAQINITESEIKFFLSHLKNGNINDEKYRKTLINVFVNTIYLYDDKITYIFNSSDHPVTVEKSLIEEIEANDKEYEGSFLNSQAPPYIKYKSPSWL